MLVRYRYRINPTGAQRQALARACGCARVVYNDALAERRRAYQAVERISDTEVQHRVITRAKRTPERAWLSEVASVALVQACQDARRAHRNWADSRTGKRKGRRVGHPRFRTKHGRQSIRLTRNGFAVRGSKLHLAKAGQVGVRWSRELPSAPSRLPMVPRTAGIDLGLVWLATIAASDGAIEAIANPRHLRAAERALARAQRRLRRRQMGSKSRAKARRRVAVAHRKVRNQRADYHHKLALRLIRENQTIAVEDLAVAGLARTRLAKSVHDAGWGTFLRLLEAKAAQYGRRVVKIGRWVPTSQTCSACGHRDGPKALGIRVWACPTCRTVHDRDGNAARNILVAAGLAETPNACGGHVRPGATLAVASEAGTHRGAV